MEERICWGFGVESWDWDWDGMGWDGMDGGTCCYCEVFTDD